MVSPSASMRSNASFLPSGDHTGEKECWSNVSFVLVFLRKSKTQMSFNWPEESPSEAASLIFLR